jgi:hypothetical protein
VTTGAEASVKRLHLCPACQGSPKSIAHFNMGDKPHEWREIECDACDGTGRVTQQRMDAITEGRRLRADRIERDMSLSEEARRLGISSVQLSRRERGYEP